MLVVEMIAKIRRAYFVQQNPIKAICREQGFEGGYDTVRRYAHRWRREHASLAAQAFVPLSFAPGAAYKFDWSQEMVFDAPDRPFAFVGETAPRSLS